MHRIAQRLAAGAHRDDGFTLAEAIVSLALFGIVVGSAVTASVASTRSAGETGNRTIATNLAQQDLQQARALHAPTGVAAHAAVSATVGSGRYTVTRAVTGTCPVVGDITHTELTVVTTVTWPGAVQPVVVGTVIAC